MAGLNRIGCWVVLAFLLFGCGEASRIEEKDRFQTDAQGIVTDTRTGRQWASDPGERMTWYQAGEYAGTLRLGGFSDWRLPTRAELQGLGAGGLDPAFKLAGCCAWSSEAETPLRPGNSISGRAGTTGSLPTATPRRWRFVRQSEGPLSKISEVKRNRVPLFPKEWVLNSPL